MKSHRERGAAMVEFAIVAPLLLLLVLGVIECGIQYARSSQLNNIAFVAARAAAVGRDPVAAANNAADGEWPPGVSAADLQVTACPAVSPLPPAPPAQATVRIEVGLESPTHFPAFPDPWSINARGVARCDG